MSESAASQRSFLFLQGPPGPFFRELGLALTRRGARVLRINLNGGDDHDWPAKDVTTLGLAPPVSYRGRTAHWPAFIDHFLRAEAITDLVLFGDCRPMHLAAHRLARLAGVRVHVFEEGYIRPNWLTLERNGVNGHSSLPRDSQAILATARDLPPPADHLPPIGAMLGRRVRDTWGYFRHMVWGAPRYPFYRSHRPGSIVVEGFGWCWHQIDKPRTSRRTEAALERIPRQPYFLFPLQLSSDYQIRVHSPFTSMPQAADYVLESFARHAPADTTLVIKTHPLDFSFFDWNGYARRAERRFGLSGRLIPVAGGDLKTLADGSLGLVTVNSTSATFALESGIPVMSLGTAVYAVDGLTHHGTLDSFWAAPQKPDPALWDAFRRVLHDRCLVRGGLASESAMRILIEGSIQRLLQAACE